MPGKRLVGWLVLLALGTSSGCCWWCDRWCPPRQSACAPVCCAAPAYAAPGYTTPPPIPAQPVPVQAGWQNPQAARPPLNYNPATGCYCEQRP
jgi:hypothetical protein